MISHMRLLSRLTTPLLHAEPTHHLPRRILSPLTTLYPAHRHFSTTSPPIVPTTPPPPPPPPLSDAPITLGALLSNTGAEYLCHFNTVLTNYAPILPSWPASIFLSALAIRLLSLPLVYHNQVHRSRFSLALKELPRIQGFVRQTPGTIFEKYVTFRRLRRFSLLSAGTSSLQLFRWDLLVHIPVIITASMGVRQIAATQPEIWRDAGVWWFKDLAAADPNGVLPVLTTMLWVWNVDPRSLKAKQETDKVERKSGALIERVMANRGQWLTGLLQTISVASLAVTMDMPAGVIVLWISNGVVTMVQRNLLGNDTVRGAIGLMTKKEMDGIEGTQVLEGTKRAVEKVREELQYVQQAVLDRFTGRGVNEGLRDEVNKVLRRERWNGRISMDLEAVIREDERNGHLYIAVVRKGTGSGT